MKKLMMFLSASVFALQVSAQSDKKAPPPPPPPPPKFQKAPPPPPVEPPPPPPKVKMVKFTPPLLVNDKGYSLSVTTVKGVKKVVIRNSKMKTFVDLSAWNSKKDFYENKYGELPPPPPPPPAPEL